MQVVVNNTTIREDSDLRERVLETMKKQIRKKILSQAKESISTKVASHSFTKDNPIQQIQNQTL